MVFAPIVIGIGLAFIGLIVHLSLDFGVEISTIFFKKHPRAYEICIQLMLFAMPLGITIDILPKWDIGYQNEIQPVVIWFAAIWPFVIYVLHKNINKNAIRLGMTSKQVGITNPILSARLNILGWIISGLLILSSLYITQFSSLSIWAFPMMFLGLPGIFSFDLFGSIFSLLGKSENAKEKENSQDTD